MLKLLPKQLPVYLIIELSYEDLHHVQYIDKMHESHIHKKINPKQKKHH